MPRVLNHKRDGLPRSAVYIGRQVRRYSLPRSKWANPFRLRSDASREDREEVIRQYERHLVDSGLINDVHELRGKDLACGARRSPVMATCCCGWLMADKSASQAHSGSP